MAFPSLPAPQFRRRWRRWVALHAAVVVAAALGLVVWAAGNAVAAVSGDAYATFDPATSTWTVGTTGIEKQVRFAGGRLEMTALTNKHSGRPILQGGNRGVEFQIVVGGVVHDGGKAGWTLTGHRSYVDYQDSVRQEITVANAKVRATLTYVVLPGSSVIEQWVTYTNVSGAAYQISDPEIIDTNLYAADMAAGRITFHHFTGGENTSDALQVRTSVPNASWVTHPRSNTWGSNEALQEVVYVNPTAGDGVVLGWSYTGAWYTAFWGNGRAQVDANGMNGATLAAGQTLHMPLTHLLAFQGRDLDDAGNALKEFQYKYKWDYTDDDLVGAVKPYVWDAGNSYDPVTTFDRTRSYAHVGADIWHWDANWYDRYGDWNNRAGNVNLAQLNGFADRSGMELMVWLSPWEVDGASAVARAHPDWLTPGGTSGGQNLKMSHGGAVTWMNEMLNAKSAQFGGSWLWRQDFGRSTYTGPGVNQVAASQAYFAMMHRFKADNPGSGINVNHAGGRQMSLESVRYGDIVQTTDNANGVYSVHTPTYLFPPDKLWGTTRVNTNITWNASLVDLRAQLATAWQWDGAPAHTYPQLEAMRRNADIYHFMKARGLAGRWVKVYHPQVVRDAPQYYLQRMSRDNKSGVIIAMHSHADANLVVVKPKGLLPDLNYTVTFQNSRHQVTNTGRYWMDNGIGATDWGGDLVWLNVTDFPGAGTDTVAPTAPAGGTKRAATYLGRTGTEITWSAGTDDRWVSHYRVLRNGAEIGKRPKARFFFDPYGTTADTYQVQTVDGDGNVSPAVTVAAG